MMENPEIQKITNDIEDKLLEIISLQKKKNELTGLGVKRYAVLPILDHESYEFYLRQLNILWTSAEINFVADIKDYDTAKENIRHCIDMILVFFLSGDGIIAENILYRFLTEASSTEEKMFFTIQTHIEVTHAECYGFTAMTFKKNADELAKLLEEKRKYKSIQMKLDFIEKWMEMKAPRYQRLVAAACTEGIFFCNLFNTIFWLRSTGKFKNFIFLNELISRDESIHRDYDSMLVVREINKILSQFKKGTKEYDEKYEEIYNNIMQVVLEAVNIEDMCSEDLYSVPLEELTVESSKIYTRVITDSLLYQFGLDPIYKLKNPYPWMDDITLEQKSNFYEVSVGSYKKGDLSKLLDWKSRTGITQTQTGYEDLCSADF